MTKFKKALGLLLVLCIVCTVGVISAGAVDINADKSVVPHKVLGRTSRRKHTAYRGLWQRHLYLPFSLVIIARTQLFDCRHIDICQKIVKR